MLARRALWLVLSAVAATAASADDVAEKIRDVGEHHDPDSPEAAAAIDRQVRDTLTSEGPRAAGLEELALRALAIRESADPIVPLDVAESLGTLADLYVGRAEYGKALPLFERVLTIQEQEYGRDSLEVTEGLVKLGSFYGRTGQRGKAVPLLERALEIRTRELKDTDVRIADTLEPLAMSLPAAEDRRADLLEQALAVRESSQGPDHKDVGKTLTYLGLVMRQQSRYEEASALYERALKLLEAAYGPENYRVATVLNKLAVTWMFKGDHHLARGAFERCLRIREVSLGPQHPDVALTLNNLAIIDWETGRYTTAEGYVRRALDINRAVYGDQHERVASTLNNLGIILELQGDLPGARSALRESLAIREARPEDRSKIPQSLHGLGRLVEDQAEARVLLERGLGMIEEIWGSDHRDYALTQTMLGVNLVSAGESAAGVELIERSANTLRTRMGPGSSRLVETTVSLAQAYLRAGRADQAFETSLEAEALARDQFRQSIRSLTEKEAFEYSSSRVAGLDLALALLIDQGERAPEDVFRVFDRLVRSRALILDEIASRHPRFLDDAQPGLVEDVERAREDLARLGVGQLSARPSGELAAASRAVQVAERKLAEQSREYRLRLRRFQVGASDVAATLDPNTVLVSYVRHRTAMLDSRHWNFTRPDLHVGAEQMYSAFVLRGGVPGATVIPLGRASEIDALVEGWIARIREPQPVFAESAGNKEVAYRESARALRLRIWDPLALKIGDASLVIVVPSGRLHDVAWGALPDDAGGYLAMSAKRIHYLSAERDLVATNTRSPTTATLLVGGPDYGEASSDSAQLRGSDLACRDLRRLQFDPLPGSRLEVEEIARLLSADAVESTVSLLTGASATETAFKTQAPGKRLIHVATHGFFVPNACASELGTPPSTTLRDNPLLLSGLVFANANRRHRGDSPSLDDGILTGQEIASLDLSEADWVVLSACESGLGKAHGHEGTLGLKRAFRMAGANSVLTSLWDVGDETARRWMAALYRARLSGSTTADAVRTANIESIEQCRERGHSTHPAHWGGFIASGDWR